MSADSKSLPAVTLELGLYVDARLRIAGLLCCDARLARLHRENLESAERRARIDARKRERTSAVEGQ